MPLPPELQALDLTPHPEGGFFRETHRSAHCTVIDFVLLHGQVSRWHRVHGGEEVWLHHRGAPLDLHLWDEQGPVTCHRLGAGQATAVVPPGVWQAAEPVQRPGAPSYSWVSCVVSPPFQFENFELGTAAHPRQPGLERFEPV